MTGSLIRHTLALNVTTLIYIDYIFLYVSGLNRKVCGSKAPTGYYETTLNMLTVRFKTDSWSNENGFHIIITSYHEGLNTVGLFQEY